MIIIGENEREMLSCKKNTLHIFDKCNTILFILIVFSLILAILLKDNQCWLGIFMSIFATVATTFLVRMSDINEKNREARKALILITPQIKIMLSKLSRLISITESFELINKSNQIIINEKIIYFKRNDGTMDYVNFEKDYKKVKKKFINIYNRIVAEPMYFYLNVNISNIISNIRNSEFLFYFEKAIEYYNNNPKMPISFGECRKEFDDLVDNYYNLSKSINNKSIIIQKFNRQTDEEMNTHRAIIDSIYNFEQQEIAYEVLKDNISSSLIKINNVVYRIN